MQSLDCTKVVYVKCRQNVANELGECGALSGEREQVVWSICVAQAIKYPFQSPSSQSAHNVYTGNEITSVMIYHRGASLSEEHTDLLICHCTKQDLLHTSTCRYVEKSSPEIARYCIRMPTAREATLSEATYA